VFTQEKRRGVLVTKLFQVLFSDRELMKLVGGGTAASCLLEVENLRSYQNSTGKKGYIRTFCLLQASWKVFAW
jgi:hypothetical protein